MKKCTLVLITILFCLSAIGQSISVSSFRNLETDMTANTTGTMEKDQNGEVAALIKVVTTQTGFTFDGGSLGIVKTKQTPGEIWVYVPRGAKKITIKHPQLGVLRDYYYTTPIQSGRTYELVLTTGTVQTIVTQANNSQYLVIKVTPANALVELNNEILVTTEGIAQKFVNLGTYEYRVQAPNYHTSAGMVTIDDPNNKKILEVSLQPAFGWIEIPSSEELNGAQVYIDNALVGTVPLKTNNLSSGEHHVKIVKSLYSPYSQTVKVNDNQTTRIEPHLNANFSNVTINVENDADIYVNGEKKGTSTWTGNLESGVYLMEAKKASHRSTSTNIEITASQPNRTIDLTSPIPIYGSANITSTPPMSDVWIDGISFGQTPLYVPQLLIGQHQIEVKRDGYGTYQSLLNVLEGQKSDINASLKNTVPVTIKTNLSYAIIYIDGKQIGKGSIDTDLTLGEHLLEAKAGMYTYLDYSERINVTSSSSLYDIYLEERSYVVHFSYDFKPSKKDPIYISIDDGQFLVWDGYDFQIKLSTGQHKIVIRHKGINEIVQDIQVDHSNVYWRIHFKERRLISFWGFILQKETRANDSSTREEKQFDNSNSVTAFAPKMSINSKRYSFPLFGLVDGLKLETIEVDDNYTKVSFNYYAPLQVETGKIRWINISPDTYIQDQNMEKYKLLHVDGISVSPARTYLKIKEVHPFVLYFQSIGNNAEKISLIEPGESPWKFEDVYLK